MMGQLNSVHARHANIGKQEIERLVVEAGEPVGSVTGFNCLVSVESQCPRNE
ncbi:hypothetical protein SJ05684_c26690 [Sinorhizobium sojae CCBAU 05684]|uniref:Uncharacterized protein n=1 Tax=Sinorhizobium sojae CCBAU 05684 TaxID=716928 RepID=A0A249PDU5_9HYPH|nr:hypothetical protein SJ05684_c26690 [Sinorhizobium sojae CCBAU 05684]